MNAPLYPPTEAALRRSIERGALAALPYLGSYDKVGADGAASQAIRAALSHIDCTAMVRIGEGLKDSSAGIYEGETLGSCRPGSLQLELAIDPIDGTTLLSRGEKGSISVAAFAWRDGAEPYATPLIPGFAVHYVQKLSVGPAVRELSRQDLDATLSECLSIVAGCLGKKVRDLVVAIQKRPRHEHQIEELLGIGCTVRCFQDGDVAAAIAPCLPEAGVDLFVGTGGSPEAVLAAAAVRCLGGQLLCRSSRHGIDNSLVPEDASNVLTASEVVKGGNVLFVAVGITDSPLLRGVRYRGDCWEVQSLVVRSGPPYIRRVTSFHSLSKERLRQRRA